MSSKSVLAVTVVLPLSAGCGGMCASEPASRPAISVGPEHPNVVVVTLDTVRADRFGAYGHAGAATPTFDRLAAEGVRFDRAYSPLPMTIPSHAAMFTGLYPPRLGLRTNGDGRLADHFDTLAERFFDAGYTTGASVGAFVTQSVWGFDQGFESFSEDISHRTTSYWDAERPGDDVVADALSWREGSRGGQPDFLWVHLFDAHFPYTPTPALLERFGTRLYDAEIAFLDEQLARLVEAYAGEPTVFVVVGDHGEALGEHGERTHGLYVYEATQRVPMVVSGAGVAPEVRAEPVSLVDVFPWALERAGLDVPGGLDGRIDRREDSAPLYLESYQLTERFGLAPHVGLVDSRWKYIAAPTPELYDLAADPGEATNVAAAHPEEVRRLSAALDGLGFEPPEHRVETGLAAQLEQLGYVSGPGSDVDYAGPLGDVKDHADLISAVQEIDQLVLMREREQANARLRELTAKYPDIAEFPTRLASFLIRDGELDEAAAVVKEGLARRPGDSKLRSIDAFVLTKRGEHAAASRIYRTLAEEIPDSPRIRSMAIASLAESGDIEEAVLQGQAWRQRYPHDTSLAGTLGLIMIRGGAPLEGLRLLDEGVTSLPPERDVAYYLAAAAVGRGDVEDAVSLLEVELRWHPRHAPAAHTLLKLQGRLERWPALVAEADRQIALNPASGHAWYGKVLGLFNQKMYGEARVAVDAGLQASPGYPYLMLMDANLLAKEGRREEGAKRFAAAQERKAAWERARDDEFRRIADRLTPPQTAASRQDAALVQPADDANPTSR